MYKFQGGGTPPLHLNGAVHGGAGSPRPSIFFRPGVFFLALAAALLGTLTSGRAQTASAQPIGPPDVLLIVSQRPTGGDLLNLTYGKTVPHDQVRRDLAALAHETGWTLSAPKITDAAPAVRASPGRALGRMTGVVVTTPQAVQAETHSFPISAIASAFRGYRRIAAVFFTAPGFTFQGPRAYADKNIKVTLAGGGTSYTCQIEILDPSFSRLDLPLSQPAPSTRPRTGTRTAALLAVVGAAAGTGLLVYLLLVRRMGRAEAELSAQLIRDEEERKTHV